MRGEVSRSKVIGWRQSAFRRRRAALLDTTHHGESLEGVEGVSAGLFGTSSQCGWPTNLISMYCIDLGNYRSSVQFQVQYFAHSSYLLSMHPSKCSVT